MDLQFINVSDPQQIKSGQARHLVRSQAMRSYRHRQREYVQTSRVSRGPPQPQRRLYKALQQYPSQSVSPRDPKEEDEEEDVIELQTHFSTIFTMARGHNFSFFPRSLSQTVVCRVLNYCTRPSLPYPSMKHRSCLTTTVRRCAYCRLCFSSKRQIRLLESLREKYPPTRSPRWGAISCHPC